MNPRDCPVCHGAAWICTDGDEIDLCGRCVKVAEAAFRVAKAEQPRKAEVFQIRDGRLKRVA